MTFPNDFNGDYSPTLEVRKDRGSWMQTYTGKAFYAMDARAEDIDIADIAHSLSLQCRYNGHVDRFYSVAEHCVLLAELFPDDPNMALWALLHDAAEAYIGDMVRPLKKHMPTFMEIDDHITSLVAQRFELVGTVIPPEVHHVDSQILHNEREALMARVQPPQPWDVPGGPIPGVEIIGHSPEVIEEAYLTTFARLIAKREDAR